VQRWFYRFRCDDRHIENGNLADTVKLAFDLWAVRVSMGLLAIGPSSHERLTGFCRVINQRNRRHHAQIFLSFHGVLGRHDSAVMG
jgi:hypothetical protein